MCISVVDAPFPAPQFCLGQRVEATGSFDSGRIDRAIGLIHGLVHNPAWDQRSIGWYYFVQFDDGISDDVHEDQLRLVSRADLAAKADRRSPEALAMSDMQKHPILQEILNGHIAAFEDHPGRDAWVRLCYRQSLANRIGKVINSPNHISEQFAIDRLEKALLILLGEQREE